MTRARERDLMALQLRLRGESWQRIADQMGFRHPSQAYAIWKRAMDRTCREVADNTRKLESDRLDALWRVMFAKAMAGSCQAVDRCLMIMDRRARLWGLDAPVNRYVGVVGMGQLVEAVEKLERENYAMEARIADRMAGIDAEKDILDADLIDEGLRSTSPIRQGRTSSPSVPGLTGHRSDAVLQASGRSDGSLRLA